MRSYYITIEHSRRSYECRNLAHRPTRISISSRPNTLRNSIEFFLTLHLGVDLRTS